MLAKDVVRSKLKKDEIEELKALKKLWREPLGVTWGYLWHGTNRFSIH